MDPRTAALLEWFDLTFKVRALERKHCTSLAGIREHGPLGWADWLIAALGDHADALDEFLQDETRADAQILLGTKKGVGPVLPL